MLEAEDVAVAFDDETVFDGLSLSVPPGEVTALVGPSGAGKTTLLRLLALFRRPDAGGVCWERERLWSLDERERLAARRRLATVFQTPSLFDAPVHRNVTYGLRVRRSWPERLSAVLSRLAPGIDVPEPAARALHRVGLSPKAEQNALSLSGGEAQRAAFARALTTDPDVLLLDEPTSNLDPRNTAVIESAVADARDRGVGVLLTTHDMHQARRLADRVAFLLGGELVETGPAEQLFEAPEDPRTRRFVAGELVYGD